jgi:hypothetical protein
MTLGRSRFGLMALVFLLALSPAPARAQQVIAETESKFVYRNDRTVIWFSFQVDEQCRVIRGFNVAVERLPKNGTVSLAKVNRLVDRTFFNFRLSPQEAAIVTRCQGKAVPVIEAAYTGRKDYSGFDDLLIAVTSADRSVQRRVEMKIGVR